MIKYLSFIKIIYFKTVISKWNTFNVFWNKNLVSKYVYKMINNSDALCQNIISVC